MPSTDRTVAVRQDPNGVALYLIGVAPDQLPPVRARDLAAAWDAARSAALDDEWGAARLFRFAPPDSAAFDFALVDADACCWTQAVAATQGLGHAYGISVCLRLLGLVHLLADAAWARPLFSIGRDGTRIAPALLAAVALLRLTTDARLDQAAVRTACRANLSLPSRTGYQNASHPGATP